MNASDIFHFSTSTEYVAAILGAEKGPGGRKISYRQWAKKLGYRSPRTVGMIVKGQRLPSRQMVEAWGEIFKLSKNRKRYFALLVHLDEAKKKNKPTQSLIKELNSVRPIASEITAIDLKSFAYIAEWYHLVIKQLIETPGFKMSANWIKSRLRSKVTVPEVQRAIQNMLDLGILCRDGEILKVIKQNLTTSNDIPAEAIRLHHSQMLDRAKEALVEQGVSQREFSSATFRMDPAQISKAKERLREFRRDFEAEFHSPSSNSVYQLSLQLFSHTENEV